MPSQSRFDHRYYARHYAGPDPVGTRAQLHHLATAVCGWAAWLGVPVARVLDVGAGVGWWRAWFRRNRPKVRYRSVDVSPYACARFGHERRDIARWRARERFDLVVCQSVLQYLDDAACEAAIENLAAMCRGVLYLEAITAHDVAEVLDHDASDLQVHRRTGAWYRRRLAPHFRQLGGGLWLSRSRDVPLFELEAAGR